MADLEAARREERDFLLASLDDLDAEFAAGDLDLADYEGLRSDYTTRAAAAIRALERASEPLVAPARSWRRTAVWTVLIVVVAGLAGMWLAEFSGSRNVGDVITGNARESVRERLFAAGQLSATDPAAALAIYDDVLEESPSNAEALAYRGWLTNLAGDRESAGEFLERAVLADPGYPDARVFAALVALRSDDLDAATAHLATLDELDVPWGPADLERIHRLRVDIVEAWLLTGEPDAFARSGLAFDEVARVVGSLLASGEADRALLLYDVLLSEASDDEQLVRIERMRVVIVEARLVTGEPGAFAASSLTVDEVVRAAESLSSYGEVSRALALYGVLLTEARDDLDVATEAGWFLGRLARNVPELVESMGTADELLSEALVIDAAHPPALVYRAFVRLWLDDLAAARGDLAAYDALDAGRDDLDLLIEEEGLRAQLA